jgi:hypothetical protein
MELAQVLPKVILPTEGTLSHGLPGTYVKLMLFPVSRWGEWGVAEDAPYQLRAPLLLQFDKIGCAHPRVQLKVYTLFMSSPVMSFLERLCAESALILILFSIGSLA